MKSRSQCLYFEAEVQEAASKAHAALLSVTGIARALDMVPEFEDFLERKDGTALKRLWAEPIGSAVKRYLR